MRKITDRQIEEAMQLFSAGASYSQVNKATNLSKATMFRAKNIRDERMKAIANRIGYTIPGSGLETIQMRALRLIKKHEGLSCSDVATRLNVEVDQARGAIYRLVADGCVISETRSVPARFYFRHPFSVSAVMRAIAICYPLAKAWQESKKNALAG